MMKMILKIIKKYNNLLLKYFQLRKNMKETKDKLDKTKDDTSEEIKDELDKKKMIQAKNHMILMVLI